MPPAKTISAIAAQEVNKQRMNKQVSAKPSRDNAGGTTMMKDRYYVQRLTEQIFLIRERISADGEPGPDDRIVRSFTIGHDAYMYADSMNDRQRKLDEH